jgi:hypothetical protein
MHEGISCHMSRFLAVGSLLLGDNYPFALSLNEKLKPLDSYEYSHSKDRRRHQRWGMKVRQEVDNLRLYKY